MVPPSLTEEGKNYSIRKDFGGKYKIGTNQVMYIPRGWQDFVYLPESIKDALKGIIAKNDEGFLKNNAAVLFDAGIPLNYHKYDDENDPANPENKDGYRPPSVVNNYIKKDFLADQNGMIANGLDNISHLDRKVSTNINDINNPRLILTKDAKGVACCGAITNRFRVLYDIVYLFTFFSYEIYN
jgi:hypothetical protein